MADHLQEVFGLLAYENPRCSPLAHLLDPGRRAPLAATINMAILGAFACILDDYTRVMGALTWADISQIIRDSSAARRCSWLPRSLARASQPCARRAWRVRPACRWTTISTGSTDGICWCIYDSTHV